MLASILAGFGHPDRVAIHHLRLFPSLHQGGHIDEIADEAAALPQEHVRHLSNIIT
jgi:hypothetical protein